MASQKKTVLSELGKKINNIFTPTGNNEDDKNRALEYAKEVGMDQANTKMAVVMATQGKDAAAKAMLADCGNDYAAMRARYG